MTTTITTSASSQSADYNSGIPSHIVRYASHNTLPLPVLSSHGRSRVLASASLFHQTQIRRCMKLAVATIVGFLGIVATWWALDLAMWTAVKEYRDDCRNQLGNGHEVSDTCREMLEQELSKPPTWRSFVSIGGKASNGDVHRSNFKRMVGAAKRDARERWRDWRPEVSWWEWGNRYAKICDEQARGTESYLTAAIDKSKWCFDHNTKSFWRKETREEDCGPLHLYGNDRETPVVHDELETNEKGQPSGPSLAEPARYFCFGPSKPPLCLTIAELVAWIKHLQGQETETHDDDVKAIWNMIYEQNAASEKLDLSRPELGDLEHLRIGEAEDRDDQRALRQARQKVITFTEDESGKKDVWKQYDAHVMYDIIEQDVKGSRELSTLSLINANSDIGWDQQGECRFDKPLPPSDIPTIFRYWSAYRRKHNLRSREKWSVSVEAVVTSSEKADEIAFMPASTCSIFPYQSTESTKPCVSCPAWIDHEVASEGIRKQGDVPIMYGGVESYWTYHNSSMTCCGSWAMSWHAQLEHQMEQTGRLCTLSGRHASNTHDTVPAPCIDECAPAVEAEAPTAPVYDTRDYSDFFTRVIFLGVLLVLSYIYLKRPPVTQGQKGRKDTSPVVRKGASRQSKAKVLQARASP